MTRKTLALLALMIGISVHGHGHAQEVDWKERLEGRPMLPSISTTGTHRARSMR